MEEKKTVVNVVDVTVRFNMASERIDNLKEYFIKLMKRELMFKEFLALKHVSLEIKQGEAWGLIGTNGSGKSTLLKLICGILKPYKGNVTISGSIAPLIELGAGFDPELTARENIFLNGAVLGHDEEFMRQHFDEIVEFAELQDFLDMPIKNYSSGMAARLGFAIATMVKTDILICDEVLSVGDYAFQQKCEDRMQALLSGGTTLLYVSHAIDSVKRLCDHAIWLNKGETVMKGEALSVCDAYIKDLTENIQIPQLKNEVEYVVIQAGGKGSRLKSLTKNKPKGIVPVNNLPIIFHLFNRYPDKKFIIIGDYKYNILERYLEAFCKVKYMTVKAEGTGTCAGIGKAMEYIPSGKPLMIIWSDLILGDSLNIDYTEGNVIGISKNFECRWSYNGEEFEEKVSKEQGVAGLFIFENKSFLRDVPLEGEFVKWLKNKKMKFAELPLTGTVETGTLLAINEVSRNLSNYRCRPFNSIDVHDGILIKKPVDDQGRKLANREVRWYQEVQKYNFTQIPKIYEYVPLTMEKINGENIFKVELSLQQKQDVIKKLVSSLNDLHSLATEPKDVFSVIDTYYNKTFLRLDAVRNLVPFADKKEIQINSRMCRNPFYHREQIHYLVRYLCLEECEDFCLIHGDCTFSNTMIDESLNVIFLDPRGYFGQTELYGDADYDWAKLYYSIYGDYDQFNNKNFELTVSENGVTIWIETNGWKDLAGFYLTQIPNVNAKKIKLLHALIWLSLTTYAWEDYDSICGAFYNGTLLLEEVLGELEEELEAVL